MGRYPLTTEKRPRQKKAERAQKWKKKKTQQFQVKITKQDGDYPPIKKQELEPLKEEKVEESPNVKVEEGQKVRRNYFAKERARINVLVNKIYQGQREYWYQFQTLLQRHIKMGFKPKPLSSLGSLLLTDAKFLISFYRVWLEEEDNPFLMSYVLRSMVQRFKIFTNKEYYKRAKQKNQRELQKQLLRLMNKLIFKL